MRRRLMTNLLAYDGPVWLVTVTGPGYDVLPRGDVEAADEWNRTAPARWSELHRRAQQAVRRRGLTVTLLVYEWQLQARGVLHLHLALGRKSAVEVAGARAYVVELRRLAREHGFGFIDAVDRGGKSGRSRVMEPHRAAGYLSRYLADSAQFMQALRMRHRPRRLVYVSPLLTKATGCTMRRLRRARFLWHLRNGSSVFAAAGRLPRWLNDASEHAAVAVLLRGQVLAGAP